MLETSIIVFREGLEAFLIVAIILAYLARTGKTDLMKPVFFGIGAAILLSATTAWHIAEMAEDPFMEGILALAAGALVATMTYMVMKNAKNIPAKINEKIEAQASKTGNAAIFGMFIFTVVMIAREGMETAMMLGALSSNIAVSEIAMGAAIGVAGVVMIAYLWKTQSQKINLRLFMQVTGIFLMLFCAHLFLYGFHELTEVSAVPFIDNFYWHTVTEPLEPSEPIGRLITISLLAIPCGWLFIGYIKERMNQNKAVQASAE